MFQSDSQQFMFYDKYARWNGNRRETWPETVQRVTDFLQELSQNKLPQNLYKTIYKYILEGKVTPSMRLLASAGPQARKNHISVYNCFRRDTEFITTSGVKSFLDFEDGDTLIVLDHTGTPQQALVRNYGPARMRKLTLHKGRHVSRSIYVTENHRWLMSDGTETTALKSGDYLLSQPALFDQFEYETASPFERLYWCYGFVYGDGTRVKDQNDEHKYSMVRLCGEDIKYEPRFLEMGFQTSSSLSLKGDVMVYTGSYLKTLPNPELDSIANLRAFVRGYLDADGAKNNSPNELSSFKSITTYDKTTADFIKKVFPLVGVHVFSEDVLDGTETNYGLREFCRTFRISTNLTNKTNGKFRAEFSDKWIEEDAWCLEVENTHSFLLNIGVATGNCSFLGVDALEAFAEALFISMSGCGVGFSVEHKYINQLPDLPSELIETNKTFTVADSAEGWYDALLFHLRSLFNGEMVRFDYSQIRPRGAILKTKGGRASGPEPLKKLLDFITWTFETHYEPYGNLAGSNRLSSLEVFDIMCHVGNCAVSGGSRRSAMLALFDLDDEGMKNAKTGSYPWVRSIANNSAVWPKEGIEFSDFAEWMAHLFKYNNGEYSVWNPVPLQAIKDQRDISRVRGCNPCFAAGTLVTTSTGILPVESLLDRPVEIWNGQSWELTQFEVTGRNQPTVEVTMQDGSQLVVTPYHRLILETGETVEVKDLVVGDKLKLSNSPVDFGHPIKAAYLKGFLAGDGTQAKGRPILYLYSPKVICSSRLIESAKQLEIEEVNTNAIEDLDFVSAGEERTRMTGLSVRKTSLMPYIDRSAFPIEMLQADRPSRLEFIAGYLDADGTAMDTKNGFGYQVSSIHKEWLQVFQAILKSVGIQSKLSLNKSETIKDFNDGYGFYPSQALYRLTISQSNSIKLAKQVEFSRLTSFANKTVTYQVKTKANIVTAIREVGIQDEVYCCGVKSNETLALGVGIMSRQCGEINLRDMQFCNLSSAICKEDDDVYSLAEKVKVAALIGTIQATATNFPLLRHQWKENCEEERLLGVDLNGIMDCPLLIHDDGQVLSYLREVAQDTNKWAAKLLEINPATAVTCVKPNGNSSELLNCSSGMKPREAQYYRRRYRVTANSPVYKVLFASGVPLMPENEQTWETMNTAVATFYVRAPEGAKLQSDFNAVQMCEFWLKLKLYWTDHNPSVTIRYKPGEEKELFDWLWEHRDVVGGMTFLPVDQTAYEQPPYEAISEEEYYLELDKFPRVKWELLQDFEQEDMTTSTQELACGGASTCDVF